MEIKGLLTAAAVGGALLLGASMAAAPANAGATGTVKVRTQRTSAPNLNSQVGWWEVGRTVDLQCSKHGQAVKGYFSFNIPNGGWDNLWYKTSSGEYIADVDIDTGTLEAVAPDCDTLDGQGQAQPKPQQSSGKEDRAVAWANGQVGSDAYNFACGRFVANAYGKGSLGYESALAFHDALQGAGQIHGDMSFPKGALVFSRSSYDLGNGHVVIARGDGKFVSGGVSTSYGSHHTVQVLSSWNPSPGATYLGWAYPPADWPGP
ncbi:MAG: hypothetical protein WAM92_00890 [Mycobacterium sp.]